MPGRCRRCFSKSSSSKRNPPMDLLPLTTWRMRFPHRWSSTVQIGEYLYVPCTFNPASTWILAPVILVFFASMMNASAQSCRSVSCFSAAADLDASIFSSEYFLPYNTNALAPDSEAMGVHSTEKQARELGTGKKHTHSVSNSPGRTVLTRILGPCVAPRHLMSWSCAALVTA